MSPPPGASSLPRAVSLSSLKHLPGSLQELPSTQPLRLFFACPSRSPLLGYRTPFFPWETIPVPSAHDFDGIGFTPRALRVNSWSEPANPCCVSLWPQWFVERRTCDQSQHSEVQLRVFCWSCVGRDAFCLLKFLNLSNVSMDHHLEMPAWELSWWRGPRSTKGPWGSPVLSTLLASVDSTRPEAGSNWDGVTCFKKQSLDSFNTHRQHSLQILLYKPSFYIPLQGPLTCCPGLKCQ